MKIILLTGNGGSGKTVLSYFLAEHMSKKQKTVLIQSDTDRPTTKMLLPNMKLNHSHSLGKVLSVPDVTQAMIIENMHVLNDNFAVLSYGINETMLSYPEPTRHHVTNFFKALALIADVVIIDAQTNHNVFDENIRDNVDCVIKLVTGDSKGVVYAANSWNSNPDYLVVNQVNPYNSIDDVAKSISASIQFEYNKELAQIYSQSDISDVKPTKSMVQLFKKIEKKGD